MSKFNRHAKTPPAAGPVQAAPTTDTRTHAGGAGHTHTLHSEVFLLGVANMVGEDTFYEKAGDRDTRFRDRIRQVAVADPAWTTGFLRWLRTEAHMRTASMVGALEAADAMLAAKIPGGRRIVDSVLQRADEPGEAVAYWLATRGRRIPKPVKRGIADAATRLYTQLALLKYDTSSHAVRFADVIDLVHPTPSRPAQGHLFRHALNRRHDRDIPPADGLGTLHANAALRASDSPQLWLDPDVLRAAGMTWEDALSAVGSTVDRKALWEALIPTMGYMALARNLRNFDEAGVSDPVAATVAARLGDPDEVARSRQLPFRFVSAYRAAPSLRWAQPLEVALRHSLSNIPTLPGRSLVLVDTSASMSNSRLSGRSTVTPALAAAVFGVALALRGDTDLAGFADGVFHHPVPQAAALLTTVDAFQRRTGEVGHGTRIAHAIRSAYRGQDRVFVISDMQTADAVEQMDRDGGAFGSPVVPRGVPIYGFNLGGYRATAFAVGAPGRHEFGGLTDATFRLVPLIEAGAAGVWPWLDGP